MTTLQSPAPLKPKPDTILLSIQTGLMEREEGALVPEKSLRKGTMEICTDGVSLKLLWKVRPSNEIIKRLELKQETTKVRPISQSESTFVFQIKTEDEGIFFWIQEPNTTKHKFDLLMKQIEKILSMNSHHLKRSQRKGSTHPDHTVGRNHFRSRSDPLVASDTNELTDESSFDDDDLNDLINSEIPLEFILGQLADGDELDFSGLLSDSFSDSEDTMEDEFFDSPVAITLKLIHDLPLPTGTMFNRVNEPSYLISPGVLQNLRQRSEKRLNHSQSATDSDAFTLESALDLVPPIQVIFRPSNLSSILSDHQFVNTLLPLLPPSYQSSSGLLSVLNSQSFHKQLEYTTTLTAHLHPNILLGLLNIENIPSQTENSEDSDPTNKHSLFPKQEAQLLRDSALYPTDFFDKLNELNLHRGAIAEEEVHEIEEKVDDESDVSDEEVVVGKKRRLKEPRRKNRSRRLETNEEQFDVTRPETRRKKRK
ncbi:hypothetical protein BLNAU_15782 [Blattamonas nauphoetae]|uniref:Pru domain-containing protein n=1 Tax=Blattamonas nauphoetae TaxID=2049346 RepID=A0ABQ9XGA7_9EUKA|nr:hypothetical protein BLNAU_15782 [Blattamonas nauphoetae]